MTTYVRRQINVSVAENQNQSDLIFSRGGSEVKYNADDALAEAEMLKYDIPIPATDKDLMEGSTISVGRILFIETDTEIVVKLDNTGDTGFTVKPVNSSTRGVLYLEGNFTHVYVSVAGTSGNANVVAGIVGA